MGAGSSTTGPSTACRIPSVERDRRGRAWRVLGRHCGRPGTIAVWLHCARGRMTAVFAGLRRCTPIMCSPCGRIARASCGSARQTACLSSNDPTTEPSFHRVEPDPSTRAAQFGQVRALAEGRDGTLWIGTLSGLFRRLPDGRIVRDPTVRDAKEIRSLLADRHGRIWIGHDSGLSVVVPTPLSASPGPPLPTQAASSVCRADPDDVRLPMAPGEACRFETVARLPAMVRSLSEGSDGRVWIGTPGGLIEFDGKRFRATREGMG